MQIIIVVTNILEFRASVMFTCGTSCTIVFSHNLKYNTIVQFFLTIVLYCVVPIRALVRTLENRLVSANRSPKSTKKALKTSTLRYLKMRPRIWFLNRVEWVLWGPRNPNLPSGPCSQAKNWTIPCYHTCVLMFKHFKHRNLSDQKSWNRRLNFELLCQPPFEPGNTRYKHQKLIILSEIISQIIIVCFYRANPA